MNYRWGGHGDEFITVKKMYPVIGKTVLRNTRMSGWNFVYAERYVILIKMEHPVSEISCHTALKLSQNLLLLSVCYVRVHLVTG
jgi:hypothetical protein